MYAIVTIEMNQVQSARERGHHSLEGAAAEPRRPHAKGTFTVERDVGERLDEAGNGRGSKILLNGRRCATLEARPKKESTTDAVSQ